MIEIIALAAFAGLLIYAACSDIASLTIPNWVSIALVGAFLLAAPIAHMPLADIGMHLLFGAAILLIGFFLFAANIMGGGDAKLLAATAVWTGFPGLWTFIFWTAMVGGALALAIVAARQFLKQSESNPHFVNRLLRGETGIPYGVAIMAGGLMAIPSLPIHALTLP